MFCEKLIFCGRKQTTTNMADNKQIIFDNTIFREVFDEGKNEDLNVEVRLSQVNDCDSVEIVASGIWEDGARVWKMVLPIEQISELLECPAKSTMNRLAFFHKYFQEAKPKLTEDNLLRFKHEGIKFFLNRVEKKLSVEERVERVERRVAVNDARLERLENAPRPVIRRVLFEREDFNLEMHQDGKVTELVPGGRIPGFNLQKGAYKLILRSTPTVLISVNGDLDGDLYSGHGREDYGHVIAERAILMVLKHDCEVNLRICYNSCRGMFEDCGKRRVEFCTLELEY
jgi:hypothetical protein